MKSILLVDDSRFIRMANERSLARAGYSVVTASDGEEALRTARSRVPDLILLDMLLPKLGGPEVLRALRKDPVTASIPVIVLSSLPQTNEASSCRGAQLPTSRNPNWNWTRTGSCSFTSLRKLWTLPQQTDAQAVRREGLSDGHR